MPSKSLFLKEQKNTHMHTYREYKFTKILATSKPDVLSSASNKSLNLS